MKKKLLTLGMIGVMALSFVACGGSSDTKVIEGSNSTTASAEATGSAGYVFSYNGIDMPVDADVAPILEKLGEPKEEFTSPSCAGQGDGHLYTYDDFQIQTYPDGDTDLILYVSLRTDNVATKEGIDLASSKDDILAAYGEPSEESATSLKFEKDGVKLVFIFDGDSLISIEYDSPKN
ncbi:hypothetical protein SAMN05421493_11727 [Pseudobutyrivibrio sp. 49]|uniref:hypothetical protein n=1 Tax=unclassified Pseudobutyrivibrio TaxID=2638619 RepID=UPI0008926C39|nr:MULTISPECIES: hypothetical protein [unclassified Pseudobutyrivibrio]SDI52599.1 hypothetical protein SAMN05421493_11727 [Pseudobutyrivibrio sp. 49]SFN93437.1 hypothetical protein SAMN04487831_10564 [Pseudobutyrivibrio sp. UC1225]